MTRTTTEIRCPVRYEGYNGSSIDGSSQLGAMNILVREKYLYTPASYICPTTIEQLEKDISYFIVSDYGNMAKGANFSSLLNTF